MQIIKTNSYSIEIGTIEESTLSDFLNDYRDNKKVVIVDENTNECCLPRLIAHFSELSNAEIIVLPTGEDNKAIEIAVSVWDALTEYQVGRYDLIINVGGGVITDMGGFIASCYKRGVDFINIPTSLLAMVDASIGGKTGVNLGQYKNQIGVFSNPKHVFIDTSFLTTLPAIEIKSGLAEMIKHGLLTSRELFDEIIDDLGKKNVDDGLLLKSIECKKQIVERDYLESGERKLLNLGHTIGHAIEGVFIHDDKFTHGYCVALGLMVEAKISNSKNLLSDANFKHISERLLEYYPFPEFESNRVDQICSLLVNDKKNKEDKILSCLIKDFGDCIYDQEITKDEVKAAFKSLIEII